MQASLYPVPPNAVRNDASCAHGSATAAFASNHGKLKLMATPSLLDRVASALFGGKKTDTDFDRQLIADMIELVVEEVEPRVRFHARYKQKLESCVRASIAHLRSIG